MKLKRYNKKNEYSYSFGAYTTLELLKEKGEKVKKVFFKEEYPKSKDVLEVMDFCKKKNFDFEINPRLIQKISFKENTYVVGCFEKYECDLEENENHAVLVNPTSTGNMGTIMRNMDAFNFKNLAIVKPAVDVFNPKVVRSSMGSFFKTNFKYFNSFEEYKNEFPKKKIYTFMLNGKTSLNELVVKKDFSLVFGNESSGLEEGFKDVGESVYIPHSENVNSLNLPVSVGIVLYCVKECV